MNGIVRQAVHHGVVPPNTFLERCHLEINDLRCAFGLDPAFLDPSQQVASNGIPARGQTADTIFSFLICDLDDAVEIAINGAGCFRDVLMEQDFGGHDLLGQT